MMLDARLPRVMVAMLERHREEFLARGAALVKAAVVKADTRDVRYPRDRPGYPNKYPGDHRPKLLRSA